MALTDTNGRPYAHRDTVRPGMILVADGDFQCLKPGQRKPVCARKREHGDGLGRLYVTCQCPNGHHYLEAQDDGDGGLVGFYHAEIFEGQDPAEIFKRDDAA